MSKIVQWKRGNTTVTSTYVGFDGEITINTDDYGLHVHDGTTPGGHPIGGNASANIGNLYVLDQTIYSNNPNASIVIRSNSIMNAYAPGLAAGSNAEILLYKSLSSNTAYVSTTNRGNGNITLAISAGNTFGILMSPVTNYLGLRSQPSATYPITYAGNVVPNQSNVFSLGDSVLPVKDLWLGNSVFIKNNSLTVSNGNILLNGNVYAPSTPVTQSNISIDNILSNTRTRIETLNGADLEITANNSGSSAVMYFWANQSKMGFNTISNAYDFNFAGTLSGRGYVASANEPIGYSFYTPGAGYSGFNHYNGPPSYIQLSHDNISHVKYFANATTQMTGNLVMSATANIFGTFPNAFVQVYSNITSYSQMVMQNLSNDPLASSDVVLTSDNGTDSTYYLDMGIASSQSLYPGFGITKPNDAYIFVQGNDPSGAFNNNANLHIGSINGTVDIFCGPAEDYSKTASFNPEVVELGDLQSGLTWKFNGNGIMYMAPTGADPHYPPFGTLTDQYWVAPPSGQVNLASNDGNNYVWTDDVGSFIATNWNVSAKQWTYDLVGNLTIPDNGIIRTDAFDITVTPFGNLNLLAGDTDPMGTGPDGGFINIHSGNGTPGYGGGNISISAGSGDTQGGTISIQSGAGGGSASGGNIDITAGSGGTTGGAVNILAGSGGSSNTSGNVNITAASGIIPGNVYITAGKVSPGYENYEGSIYFNTSSVPYEWIFSQNSTTKIPGTIYSDQGFIYTPGNISLNTGIFRNGDSATSVLVPQIALGWAGTGDYTQWIHSRHMGDSPVDNAIDFYTSDGTQTGAFPNNGVLGLTITNGMVGVGQLYPSSNLEVVGTGNITSTLTVGSSMTVSGNVYGNTALSYNQPNFLTPYSGDPSWAYGLYSNGTDVFTQIKMWGGNDVHHGFRVYDTFGAGNVYFSVDGTGTTNLKTISATGNISGGNVSVTGNITGNTNGYTIGYRDIPQVVFAANATLSATDGGKHYYSTQSTSYTLTVPNNNVVSWNIGTAVSIVNRGTANVNIALGTGVSLYMAGNSTSSARVLTTYGMASLLNVAANVWMINGTGII